MRRRIGYGILISSVAFALLLAASSFLFMVPVAEIPIWVASGISFDLCIMLFNVYLQGSVREDFLGRSASSLYTFRGISASIGVLIVPIMIIDFGLSLTSFLPVLLVIPISAVIVIFSRSITNTSF